MIHDLLLNFDSNLLYSVSPLSVNFTLLFSFSFFLSQKHKASSFF